jgi:oxygen-independent coproporphyrinogen-3 oxidase
VIETIALYVHVPYCRSICPYCDFDRQTRGIDAIPRYVEALCAEIATLPFDAVHSIFFGGGTPSLLSSSQVGDVLAVARQALNVTADCEVTLEANPGECSVDYLGGLGDVGVNRLSIGVQCLDDPTLRLLGRRHTADDARRAVASARAAGFQNLSIDLMLGLPGSTVASWSTTLDRAIDLAPNHISAYILTVDERVPMGRDVAAGRLSLPADDDVADQYEVTRAKLAGAGFEHYEVSNWAQPGMASRHNLTYWRDGSYHGVGAGAVGWIGGVRKKNTPSPTRYMRGVAAGRVETVEFERPDHGTRVTDAFALGMRLREGIDLAEFSYRYGLDLSAALGSELEDLRVAGVLEVREGQLRIADRSITVLSEVLVNLTPALARAAASVDARSDQLAQT